MDRSAAIAGASAMELRSSVSRCWLQQQQRSKAASIQMHWQTDLIPFNTSSGKSSTSSGSITSSISISNGTETDCIAAAAAAKEQQRNRGSEQQQRWRRAISARPLQSIIRINQTLPLWKQAQAGYHTASTTLLLLLLLCYYIVINFSAVFPWSSLLGRHSFICLFVHSSCVFVALNIIQYM